MITNNTERGQGENQSLRNTQMIPDREGQPAKMGSSEEELAEEEDVDLDLDDEEELDEVDNEEDVELDEEASRAGDDNDDRGGI